MHCYRKEMLYNLNSYLIHDFDIGFHFQHGTLRVKAGLHITLINVIYLTSLKKMTKLQGVHGICYSGPVVAITLQDCISSKISVFPKATAAFALAFLQNLIPLQQLLQNLSPYL
jgi:hypothetical protein